MKKDDQYFKQVYDFAYSQCGSHSKMAAALSPDLKGPAVRAWKQNGVAHKWRPLLDQKFGAAFRKSLNTLIV